MKRNFYKNLLSCLMAFVMVVTMLPFQGTSTNAYAATSSTRTLYYNTGHRDTVATELSDAAEAYYADFAYDYEDIADGIVSVTADELKDALGKYMQNTLENQVTYHDLPTYWAYSDAEDGVAGVTFFYTDNNSINTGDLNREHVWPKSAASFYEMNGGADIHH